MVRNGRSSVGEKVQNVFSPPTKFTFHTRRLGVHPPRLFMIKFDNPFTQQNSPLGCVRHFFQFRTLVLSYPMILARSFCRSPNSSRRLGIASPMVVTFFGYAMSLGFFPFRRRRQKSNATSVTHCQQEQEKIGL